MEIDIAGPFGWPERLRVVCRLSQPFAGSTYRHSSIMTDSFLTVSGSLVAPCGVVFANTNANMLLATTTFSM